MTKLTNAALKGLLKQPGHHGDGGGLFFRVLDSTKAYWVYRYQGADSRRREMSLGPYPELGLAEARQKHVELRARVVADKVDPVREKSAAKQARAAARAIPTFGLAWSSRPFPAKAQETHARSPCGDALRRSARLHGEAQVKLTVSGQGAPVPDSDRRSVRRGVRHAVDLDAKMWIAPAERMKMSKAHHVPLSDAAVAILRDQHATRGKNVFVFPSPPPRPRAPLSNMAFAMAMRRMGAGEYTPHGFRSAFRDWAAEHGVEFEVAEQCLAHAVGNAVTRAYLRSTVVERRRKVMADWASFVAGEGEARVIQFRRAST
jgi:integrase